MQLPDVWQGRIHRGYPALQLSTKRLDTALRGVQRGEAPLPGFKGCPLDSRYTPRAGGWEERRSCSGDNADATHAHGVSHRHLTRNPESRLNTRLERPGRVSAKQSPQVAERSTWAISSAG